MKYRINNRGMELLCWISSALAIVFLIQFAVTGVITTLTRGYTIINNIVTGNNPKNEIQWLILLYLLSMMVSFVPFLVAYIIKKWTHGKLNKKLDISSINFCVGAYFIITNIGGVVGIIMTVAYSLFNARWGWNVHTDWTYIFYAFINSMIPIAYVALGVLFIKKSNFLHKNDEIIEMVD